VGAQDTLRDVVAIGLLCGFERMMYSRRQALALMGLPLVRPFKSRAQMPTHSQKTLDSVPSKPRISKASSLDDLILDRKAILLSESPLVIAFDEAVPHQLVLDILDLELDRFGAAGAEGVITSYLPEQWSGIANSPGKEWLRVCSLEGWDSRTGKPHVQIDRMRPVAVEPGPRPT